MGFLSTLLFSSINSEANFNIFRKWWLHAAGHLDKWLVCSEENQSRKQALSSVLIKKVLSWHWPETTVLVFCFHPSYGLRKTSSLGTPGVSNHCVFCPSCEHAFLLLWLVQQNVPEGSCVQKPERKKTTKDRAWNLLCPDSLISCPKVLLPVGLAGEASRASCLGFFGHAQCYLCWLPQQGLQSISLKWASVGSSARPDRIFCAL